MLLFQNLYRAVLQSDGSKCLTADDAEAHSPGQSPTPSPTAKYKHNTWKNSSEFLDVPNTSSSTSPRLRRHLSGSDGNLAVAGISESSRTVSRRASCVEHKIRSKHEDLHRRPRADSKIMRSTSDPHNKHVREDVLHSGRISRSASSKQSSKSTDSELLMLTETSVELESPRSTTSVSEVDTTESVDMDEIQMSLSPEPELVCGASEKHPVIGEKESAEKLKLLLAQKLSKVSKNIVSEGETSLRENTKSGTRGHGERKRVPRSSSVDRARKLGERKLGLDISHAETGGTDGRKGKLVKPSSGSRQLPDPSQITGRTRSLPKTEGNENLDGGQCCGVESPGQTTRLSKVDSQDATDAEHSRASPGPQAPPIKAPLITGLSINRTGSNGADISRKRAQLPKRSSPVLSRKSPNLLRKSMDDQLLESKPSPPLRRAFSEADAPVEDLHLKSMPSRNSDATKNSDVSKSTNSKNIELEGNIPRKSEQSLNLGGIQAKTSENIKQSDKYRLRSRNRDTTHGTSAGEDTVSKKSTNPLLKGNLSNSANSLVQEVAGKVASNTGDKPRRQMKKYRARDHKKLAEAVGKVPNVNESQNTESMTSDIS